MNIVAILVAALIPTVVGFIWYNPKVFGTAWMQAADMTEEKMKGANMGIIFGVSLVLSILLSLVLGSMVIHQSALGSLFFGMESAEAVAQLEALEAQFKGVHRTFGHGILHGLFAGILFALPVLATNALFERKGFKYIAVNAGYWIVTLALMGGLLSAWQ